MPTLGIGFVLVHQLVLARIYKAGQRRLQAEAELIAYGLKEWGTGVSFSLNYLSQAPALRQARVEDIRLVLIV